MAKHSHRGFQQAEAILRTTRPDISSWVGAKRQSALVSIGSALVIAYRHRYNVVKRVHSCRHRIARPQARRNAVNLAFSNP